MIDDFRKFNLRNFHRAYRSTPHYISKNEEKLMNKQLLTVELTYEQVCCIVEEMSKVKISDCSLMTVQPTYQALQACKKALHDAQGGAHEGA